MQVSEKTIQNELNDLRSELTSVKNTLESIKKISHDYIIRYNRDLRIVSASDSFCKKLNIPEEEIIGKGNDEIGIPSDSAGLWNKTMKNVLKSGISDRIELEFPFNGSNRVYEVSMIPDRKVNNRYQDILCIIQNVPEKEPLIVSASEVRHNEQSFHRMFDSHQAVMLIIDPVTGSIEYANKAAVKFYRYSKEQLLKMKIQEINILLPEEVESEREKALREERNYFVFPHKKANGEVTWVEVYSSPFDAAGKKLLFSVIHDISGRKVEEIALNESRYDLKLAQKVAHIGSWRLNVLKNELIWSDEAYRIFDVPSGTPLTYETFLSFVHPDDREMVDTKWNAALKGEEYNIDHRIVVDGKIKWVSETAILEFDSNGKLLSGFGTVQDITKQKEAAQEFKMSEQKLKWSLQAGKGGVWDWDLATNNIWLSEELYHLLGIDPEMAVNYDFILKLVDEHDRENALKVVWENIANKKDIQYEVRIHHPERGERWIYFHGSTIYDDSGTPTRLLGISLDVTERKQNEETLRQYAENLKFLTHTATTLIEKLGSPELFRFVSDSLYEVAGGALITFSEFDVLNSILILKEFRCTTEEKEKAIKLLGREPEGLTFGFPEEIREKLKPGELQYLEGGLFELTFGQLPEKLCTELEKVLGIKSVFAMVCSVERDILGTVAVLSHDPDVLLKNKQLIESVVTQAALALKRKHAEDELRASEEKFSAAFKSNPNGLVLSNIADGIIYDINDAFQEITGRTKEEVIGKSSLDLDIFINPIDRMNAVNLLRQEGSLRHIEMRIKHTSNTERVILLSVDLISLSGRKTMLTTMQDITVLKQAELKISEQAKFITGITEAVPDMISIIELPSRNLFYANREPFIMQGFNSDQMKKMTAEERNELMHPDDREALVEYFSKLSKLDNNGEVMLEYRARNFENKWLWFLARGRVFERHADGSVKSCINVVQNITEQKTVQNKLRDSEERLKAMFNNAAIGIVITDSEDRFIEVNDQLCQILGYKREELTGRTVHDLTAPEDRSTSKDLNERLHRGEIKIFDYEKRYLKSDNTPLWVHVTVSSVRDLRGEHVNSIATVEDISARKHMEKQLQEKNEHLTKVNELLGDFVHIAAHDLRGPISSIMMMSELIGLHERMEDKELAFNELMPVVNKLSRTVNGLLETVNIQTEATTNYKKNYFSDIFNEIILDCTNEFGRYRAKITTDFKAPEIDYVEAYLLSIMRNLITNALKYSAEVESPQIHISTIRDKEYVLLTVKDNGMGIDLEKAGENLFKPFKRFTSRAEGTGMGLYIIKNIIEKNGGHIKVESKPHQGTTFYCYLKEYSIDL